MNCAAGLNVARRLTVILSKHCASSNLTIVHAPMFDCFNSQYLALNSMLISSRLISSLIASIYLIRSNEAQMRDDAELFLTFSM